MAGKFLLLACLSGCLTSGAKRGDITSRCRSAGLQPALDDPPRQAGCQLALRPRDAMSPRLASFVNRPDKHARIKSLPAAASPDTHRHPACPVARSATRKVSSAGRTATGRLEAGPTTRSYFGYGVCIEDCGLERSRRSMAGRRLYPECGIVWRPALIDFWTSSVSYHAGGGRRERKLTNTKPRPL